MLHAVLFDLDNTLILFDEDQFFGSYLQAIPEYFRDIMPPDEFRKRLLSATRELVKNNGEMSNLEYYREICEKIKVRPEYCLMVGNDPVNDMVAGEIGMKTFLVNNSGESEELSVSEDLRKFSKTKIPGADFEGRLSDVPEVIQQLHNEE